MNATMASNPDNSTVRPGDHVDDLARRNSVIRP
jgi:hypothetical protein